MIKEMKKGENLRGLLDISLSGVLIAGFIVAGFICAFAYCFGKVFFKR